jgi:hypothetical protein
LVYFNTVDGLEVLQQLVETACREIKKIHDFLKTLHNSYKKEVTTRMGTTQIICCRANTNSTHISAGFGFWKFFDWDCLPYERRSHNEVLSK